MYRRASLLRRFRGRLTQSRSVFTRICCIRACIVALALGCIAAGPRDGERGLVLFGPGFLGEEVYETERVLCALKDGVKYGAIAREAGR